jgi:hypothetical protein
VHIVFCEQQLTGMPGAGSVYGADTVVGAFGIVSIVISPLPGGSDCLIELKVRQDASECLNELIRPTMRILPLSAAPKCAARMAVLADIACHVLYEDTIGGVSNWEARLSHIHRLRLRQRKTNTSAAEPSAEFIL